jgi:hypothetical protein
MTPEGRSELRTLKGGQILGLVRPPREKWRIRYFEHSQIVKTSQGEPVRGHIMGSIFRGEAPVLEWQTSMPTSWPEMRFESADDAVTFVEGEIAGLGLRPSIA